jgi:hypothetical protein
VAHFDTVCLPRLWYVIFRDGSKYEQNLLRLMLLFWSAALHVCTSSLSVGEVQGNVYFTTWIAFVASALNYGVWRVSAGLPSLAERVNLHHRETTFNWLWTLLCAVTFAGAVTDIYFNKEEITLKRKGKELDLSKRAWTVVLSVTWSFVGVCMIALLLNHYSTKSLDVKLCGGRHLFVLGWRQGEGFAILVMLGVFFWIIFEHTGVDGVINGRCNAPTRLE